jgi:hypothetical protein
VTATRDFVEAVRAVYTAADRLDEFTTDDVWPLLEWIPTERNVIGKAFLEARRRGYIVGTERFVRSTRPESKGRRVQVWRRASLPSLLGG